MQLAINTGSSSIKFALYNLENGNNPKCRGSISGIPNNILFSAVKDGQSQNVSLGDGDFQKAFSYLLDWIKDSFSELQLVGHRIVHGGSKYSESVCINQDIFKYLESLITLAPLHQPYNLEGVRVLQKLYPKLRHIACFDTSFHCTQPRIATLFALPDIDKNIRRYGFHGISYQYIAKVLPDYIGEKAYGKVVVAHLGHGASMCALNNLKSIATTMGFTALDGLPMGTRCGTIDPGVILYLIEEKGYSASKISDLLYNKSGLLGLSGISCDMRDLINKNTARTNEAINYFCYRICRELGSLVAALGGIDVLVFTAGIGENSPLIRQKICETSKWLNIEIDNSLNASSALNINTSNSKVDVLVIPTNEELMIAKETFLHCGSLTFIN